MHNYRLAVVFCDGTHWYGILAPLSRCRHGLKVSDPSAAIRLVYQHVFVSRKHCRLQASCLLSLKVVDL